MNRLAPPTLLLLVLGLAFAPASNATVMISGPDPSAAAVFFGLDIPPGGAFDERSFSGFEYLMSGRDPVLDPFRANDMYVIQGNDTNELQTIRTDLGGRDDLSGVTFDFSLQHNLIGGRNLTFSLFNTVTMVDDVLCWGLNCAPGSISAETINGEGPFDAFNGLQIQVRAQEVVGSSAVVKITALTGIADIVGDPFYDEAVDPTLPGTIQTLFGTDPGRRGQWMIADSLDFLLNEWELQGMVTLSRPDDAIADRTKVRLAIDLVRDPNLPYVIPEPSTGLLLGLGLLGFAAARRDA